jgi:hypothetical protein
MKIIYSLLPIFFLIACANNTAEKRATSETKLNEQNAANGSSMAEKSASIKILKDGKIAVEYSPSLPKALRMTEKSGKETLYINLDNNDNTYSLLGTVQPVASGTYALGEGDKSEAGFQFLTSGTSKLPTLMIDLKGSLKIILAGQTCSGSFTGTNDVTGKNYEISGSFTNIPIEKK